jgi:hypothetical protein
MKSLAFCSVLKIEQGCESFVADIRLSMARIRSSICLSKWVPSQVYDQQHLCCLLTLILPASFDLF